MRSKLLIILTVALAPMATQAASALDFTFALANKGKDVLLSDQDFYDRLSPSDIAIRLGVTEGNPTVADLKAEYAKGVEEWTKADIAALVPSLVKARLLLRPYAELLPENIIFVKTNRKVEGGFPHTRGNAIFLMPSGDSVNEKVILHEVFHILSRRQKERRASLYGILSFKPCTLEGPPAFKAMRLTNPDTPPGDWYIELEGDAEANAIVAHTHSRSRHFNAEFPGGFGGHLGFGLVKVNVEGTTCAPVLTDGQAKLFGPNEIPAYFEAIGRNTGYIIHPEEVLADNFVSLVLEAEGLPNPEIVTKLEAWLNAN